MAEKVRFDSVSVDVQVPENVSHVQLDWLGQYVIVRI
jgi:hypothetical protein